MNWYIFVFTFLAVFSFQTGWAQTEVGPALPDLTLPAEVEIVEEQTEQVAAVPAPAPVKAKAAVSKKSSAKKTAATKKTAASNKKAAASATQQQPLPAPVVDAAPNAVVPEVTNAAAKVNNEEIVVENLMTQAEVAPAPAAQVTAALPAGPGQAASNALQTNQAVKVTLVAYNPPTDRDPTLSPDDTLLLKHREEERLRALEAERKRKLEAERRRLAELERQRQLELERLRDPSREVRGKIRVSGIIGQEVFIGNKIYSVGQSVLGARIVSVQPDSVVFTYKGQKFTKKVELK